jgi:rare lipoprotein A
MTYSRLISRLLMLGLTLALAAGCSASRGGGGGGASQTGLASYYADKYQGRPTASGEPFDMHKMTAAHRTLPFGTVVRVMRADSGQSVTVRINDRGPFVNGRVIDLSQAAARKLGMIEAGVVGVRVDVLSSPAALARAD